MTLAPKGYPTDKGFYGTRKRTEVEKALQCHLYALGGRNYKQTLLHGYRLEGITDHGKLVTSWVNGFSNSGEGSSGDYVMYTTEDYMTQKDVQLLNQADKLLP